MELGASVTCGQLANLLITSSVDTGLAPAWLATDALLLVHSDCISSSLQGHMLISDDSKARCQARVAQQLPAATSPQRLLQPSHLISFGLGI